MKTSLFYFRNNALFTFNLLLGLLAFQAAPVCGQVTLQQITNGLVDYYPLNSVMGNTTPDVVNRRDLTLHNMTAANLVPASHPGINSSNLAFNFTQSGGPTVMYYNTSGQNPLDGSGDFLPFINQRGATMNFWIKAANNLSGSELRVMGECANDGQSSPFFSISSRENATVGTNASFFLRANNSTTDPNGQSAYLMSDGSYEDPVINNLWNQGNNDTTNAVFDNTWHMLTMEIGTNGDMHIYVDGKYDQGDQLGLGAPWTDNEGNLTVALPIPMTNSYYNTNIYPNLTLLPAGTNTASQYVRWLMPDLCNSGVTTFGGFVRNGAISGGMVGQMSDIGFWNRALTPAEIAYLATNGVAIIPIYAYPLIIDSFTADFYEVATGDQVTLRWNVTGANSITISGVGDVTALGLDGSTNVTVICDTNFTLTAANGLIAPLQVKINVIKSFPGVSSDWHLIQRFDGLFTDTTSGIGGYGWFTLNPPHPVTDLWNVQTITNSGGLNRVLTPKSGYNHVSSPIGYDSAGALTLEFLNSLTIPPNQSNTLFFRFALKEPGPIAGYFSDMDCGIGLSDSLFATGPVTGASPGTAPNVGPFISIIRNSGGTFSGGPFDLVAQDYSGSSVTNLYSYRASVDPNGLQTNVNYCVWMDIQNNNTMAVTNPGVSTNTINEAVYSVWLQKQGDAARTLLFSNFHGNRDYTQSGVNNDFPTPYLSQLFVSIGAESFVYTNSGAYIATNMIAVDDFYLSKSGFKSGIPKLFDIRSFVSGAGSATIIWDSLGSIYQTNTYSVQRKFNLTDPAWTTLTNGLPSGGDTTSFTDTTLGQSSAVFYRVTWP